MTRNDQIDSNMGRVASKPTLPDPAPVKGAKFWLQSHWTCALCSVRRLLVVTSGVCAEAGGRT